MYYRSITELVGSTPLLEPVRFNKQENPDARVLLKLEGFNPAGSVKDRVALAMILDAEAKGLLRRGAAIIEPTSGNTGIGLAAIGVPRGYRVILVMPDTMSVERRKLLAAYGAEIHLSDGKKGMQGAIERAKALAAEIEEKVRAALKNGEALETDEFELDEDGDEDDFDIRTLGDAGDDAGL